MDLLRDPESNALVISPDDERVIAEENTMTVIEYAKKLTVKHEKLHAAVTQLTDYLRCIPKPAGYNSTLDDILEMLKECK